MRTPKFMREHYDEDLVAGIPSNLKSLNHKLTQDLQEAYAIVDGVEGIPRRLGHRASSDQLIYDRWVARRTRARIKLCLSHLRADLPNRLEYTDKQHQKSAAMNWSKFLKQLANRIDEFLNISCTFAIINGKSKDLKSFLWFLESFKNYCVKEVKVARRMLK